MRGIFGTNKILNSFLRNGFDSIALVKESHSPKFHSGGMEFFDSIIQPNEGIGIKVGIAIPFQPYSLLPNEGLDLI